MMMDVEQIAAKCEVADGPNFALECEIWCALNPDAERRPVPPNYTASLDAAMTLVPEGTEWVLHQIHYDFHMTPAAVVDLSLDLVTAATPALALCAAALKARAHLEQQARAKVQP